MPLLSKLLINLFSLSSFLALVSSLTGQADSGIVIGYVKDGDSWFYDELIDSIESETRVLLDNVSLSFKTDPAFNAGWTFEGARNALEAALADNEVDLIILQGALGMSVAANYQGTLNKPVLGAFLQDPDIIGLPIRDGRSLKQNLNLVLADSTVENDMRLFSQLVRPSVVHVFINRGYMALRWDIDQVEAMGRKFGFRMEYLEMSESADEMIAQLSPDVEAVYVFPPLRLDSEERQKLLEAAIERKIPQFAFWGEAAVRDGVLAGGLPDLNTQLARRVALNIQAVVNGASPNDLDVYLPVEQKLFFNAKTAAAMEFTPSFDAIRYATIINEEFLDSGESIDLSRAVSMALSANFDLQIQNEVTEISRQIRNISRSNMLPRINSNYQRVEVDSTRASAPAGSPIAGSITPRVQQTAGITVNQMIYNDEIVSGYRSARKSFNSALEDQEAVKLNIIESTTVAYLQLLSARSILSIARDNLAVTQSNLQLARLRRQVGDSGPQDVFRFEAQEASDRSQVAEAEAQTEIARVALNQILNVDLNREWNPVDITLQSPEFRLSAQEIEPNVKDQSASIRLLQFLIQQARENSPELKSLQFLVEAQRINRGATERDFYIPDVSFQFDYDHIIDESRSAGAASLEGNNPWSAAIVLNFPILEGTGRFSDLRRQSAELNRLELSYNSLLQQIETRAQQAYYNVTSSAQNIRFSTRAAERAQSNLEVVTSLYEQGASSIIDLLDAQNEAFIQKQNATIAVYDFFQDITRLERAISRPEIIYSREENNTWLQELRRYISP